MGSVDIFTIPSPCSSPVKQQQQQHQELLTEPPPSSFDIPITSPPPAAPTPSFAPPSPPSETGGLGIVFTTHSSGEIRVKKCVPGGPADVSQAIKPGDVLVKIDGVNVVGVSLKDVQPRIVGAADSKCRRHLS
jgi:hypothetical protein